MFELKDRSSLILSSISSIGVIALVYKLMRHFRTKRLLAKYFRDKTMLITGASLGLGKAVAQEAHALGCQVILCARNLEQLKQVKSELIKAKPNGKEPEILCMDVSSKYDIVKPQIDALVAKFKRIDILVNNAGISCRAECFNSKDEIFQKVMDVNFFGAVRLTNMLVKHMFEDDKKRDEAHLKRNQFSIVNVGSVQSYIAIPHRAAYTSSKHALLAYSDSLRAELFMHRNIQVINTQPGYIDTNVSINALNSDGEKNNANDDDHRNGFSPNYVAKRMLKSIVNGEKEVLITVLLHRFAIWLRFLFPNIYFWAMFIRAKQSFDRKFQ